MTLYFYSSKAYGFVRRKLCQALPDPSTLRSWYSSISGEPGFTSESFDALKLKVDEAQKSNKKVICILMLDEISIKKGLQNVSVGKLEVMWTLVAERNRIIPFL
ncbi:unnamed protein product [Lasius platythorax]|uniref:Uncharacterized protein n=1 Tax=Lasius platythorax TaxID=488582 RepID=A0AAV2P415_9HYME